MTAGGQDPPALGRRLSVVGLGYVGLPVAVAFARKGVPVVGYDIDPGRIAALRRGVDRTGEVTAAALAAANIRLTSDPADLGDADFHIVAAPTPIDQARRPDLGPLTAAAAAVGRALRPGAIVCFESTVYPGATEAVCRPVLERESGLVAGRDFGLAYSPERINPGDPHHRFETIVKVVAADSDAALAIVRGVYASVVEAGVFAAASIATAEAAKVIENTQRDLNIALMNELAMICARLGLDSRDVIAAAATKWNFLPFTPGLVGGHCVGVDPYYLTDCAERAGYQPQVILAGRRINDGMGAWLAAETVKRLAALGRAAAGARIAILGLTFKAGVADVRNSRVADLARELLAFGARVHVHDPLADAEAALAELGIRPVPLAALAAADAVILAVAHPAFLAAGGWPLITSLLAPGGGLVVDVSGRLDRGDRPAGVVLWRP